MYIWIKKLCMYTYTLPLLVELMGKKNSKDENAIPTYVDTCMGLLMCMSLISLLMPLVYLHVKYVTIQAKTRIVYT